MLTEREEVVGLCCRVIDNVPRDGVGTVVSFLNDRRFIATANILTGFISRGSDVLISEFYPPDFVIVDPMPHGRS